MVIPLPAEAIPISFIITAYIALVGWMILLTLVVAAAYFTDWDERLGQRRKKDKDGAK